MKYYQKFALAKLFNSNNIKNITRVKYLNPYKVLLQFENESSADQLLKCLEIQQLGWRFIRPYEVDISYGVIKDIELDLEEKQILEAISSPYELVAAKRLKRRSTDGADWTESETVRLGFKGPALPEFVDIYGMKIKVNPYVFPVTQCSKCWKYGHTLRACPSKKDVCPKCTKNHQNCEVVVYKCINCTGTHRALDRICPVYRKEKHIREIMAQHNCSYRKAAMMHITLQPQRETPTSHPSTRQEYISERVSIPPAAPADAEVQEGNRPSYASKVKAKITPGKKATAQSMDDSKRVSEGKAKQQRNKIQAEESIFDWDMSSECSNTLKDIDNPEESRSRQESTKRDKRRCDMSFKQLINKLKALIFSEEYEDIMSKIKRGISLVMEWVTSSVMQYIWDLPFKFSFS